MVKETKDLLVAVNEVSLLLIKQFRDGIQVADAAALVAAISVNEELKQKLFEAYQGLSLIPSEIKSIDLAGGVELAMVQSSYVPKIIEALGK